MTSYVGKNLSDVGTRYEFYQELKELWEDGLDLIQSRPGWATNLVNRKRVRHLEIAIGMIVKHLEVMSLYSDKQIQLRREINGLPKDPAQIEGGRGTPFPE